MENREFNMLQVDFNSYNYYPTLRSRVAEIKGLRELTDDRKDKIIPLITLNNWLQYGFDRAMNNISSSFKDRPFFIDLPHQNDISIWNKMFANSPESYYLRSDVNNYKEWMDFTETFPFAIPVVQFSSKQRAVTQQAIFFEKTKGKLAFRIRDYILDTPLVINAISALQDVRNVIVFIDCQYIRDNFSYHQQMCINTINQLRAQEPFLTICVLSTSFPISPAQFTNEYGEGVINILEHSLHTNIGGRNVAIYGDHSSIHSIIYDEERGYAWSARIDYPIETDWFILRKAGAKGDGYPELAKNIVSHFGHLFSSKFCWGEKMILDASRGENHHKAPASWIAIRMNIHLSKQIDYWNATSLNNTDSFDNSYEEMKDWSYE
ncbi:hypothetical protein A1D28_09370 [Pasteurella multocida]|nr:hypothetical protein [Pasteurella multocida]